jgi:hypothetical protein
MKKIMDETIVNKLASLYNNSDNAKLYIEEIASTDSPKKTIDIERRRAGVCKRHNVYLDTKNAMEFFRQLEALDIGYIEIPQKGTGNAKFHATLRLPPVCKQVISQVGVKTNPSEATKTIGSNYVFSLSSGQVIKLSDAEIKELLNSIKKTVN